MTMMDYRRRIRQTRLALSETSSLWSDVGSGRTSVDAQKPFQAFLGLYDFSVIIVDLLYVSRDLRDIAFSSSTRHLSRKIPCPTVQALPSASRDA